ncbi:uncharacterized protein BJX67DRAFT_232920 [Aspergillus lucknowensis]|uniref:Uncharacterized protein n=1 Tax=Aspergillus lucknowensis TaxID=176173 RepID=A0ABR4LHF9_9EURO
MLSLIISSLFFSPIFFFFLDSPRIAPFNVSPPPHAHQTFFLVVCLGGAPKVSLPLFTAFLEILAFSFLDGNHQTRQCRSLEPPLIRWSVNVKKQEGKVQAGGVRSRNWTQEIRSPSREPDGKLETPQPLTGLHYCQGACGASILHALV